MNLMSHLFKITKMKDIYMYIKMKNLVLFGGTGGIGKQLTPLLEKKYNVISLGSTPVDVTNIKSVKTFFDNSYIDVVVNLSGKKFDTYLFDLNGTDVDLINDMLDVNIKGNINILSSCLPYMRENGWGRVIGISSVFSEMNVPNNSIYCASKAFMDRLYSVANKENAQYGITCNTIQLGYWDGGMCYRVDPVLQDKAKNKIPMKRWGTIEELFNTINYIVDNEYVSGTQIKIDGGL